MRDFPDAIEAERCIFNLLARSSTVQEFYNASGLADGITHRIKEMNIVQFNEQMRLLDMQILCLLTKVNVQTR